MKKILSLVLLPFVFASCGSSAGADAPAYEVEHFDIDAQGQNALYVVSTPAVYSRDSVVRVAAAIQHSALPGAECTIRLYRKGALAEAPYSTVFYSKNCKNCDFNAQDAYGSNLRVDVAPATAGVPPSRRDTGGIGDTGRAMP